MFSANRMGRSKNHNLDHEFGRMFFLPLPLSLLVYVSAATINQIRITTWQCFLSFLNIRVAYTGGSLSEPHSDCFYFAWIYVVSVQTEKRATKDTGWKKYKPKPEKKPSHTLTESQRDIDFYYVSVACWKYISFLSKQNRKQHDSYLIHWILCGFCCYTWCFFVPLSFFLSTFFFARNFSIFFPCVVFINFRKTPIKPFSNAKKPLNECCYYYIFVAKYQKDVWNRVKRIHTLAQHRFTWIILVR